MGAVSSEGGRGPGEQACDHPRMCGGARISLASPIGRPPSPSPARTASQNVPEAEKQPPQSFPEPQNSPPGRPRASEQLPRASQTLKTASQGVPGRPGAPEQLPRASQSPRTASHGVDYRTRWAQGPGPTAFNSGNTQRPTCVTHARRAPAQHHLCMEIRAPRAQRSTSATQPVLASSGTLLRNSGRLPDLYLHLYLYLSIYLSIDISINRRESP